jgi:glucose-6-phosphate isomerase
MMLWSPDLRSCPAYAALKAHALEWMAVWKRQQAAPGRAGAARLPLRDRDSQYPYSYSLELCGVYLNYSKHWINAQTLALFCQLALEVQLRTQIEAWFSGECVNYTENRAALHMLLRGTDHLPHTDIAEATRESVQDLRIKMREITACILEKRWVGFSGLPFRTVVNLGIGGSDFGPQMVYQALQPYWNDHIRCFFVSHLDPLCLEGLFTQFDPATTLFIISSKSFSTQETLHNAERAWRWLSQVCPAEQCARHFIAVTAAPQKAKAWGIPSERILSLGHFVGGRYSVWSAVGLPIALGTRFECFEGLLAGAQRCDQHFYTTPFHENIPVILAFLSLWYGHFWGAPTHAILPYSQQLALLPTYLQQLQMESNGKLHARTGEPLAYDTGPVIWGGLGTQAQHTFFQYLHQTQRCVPCDFIVPIETEAADKVAQRMLFANALAHSEVLWSGYAAPADRPYEALPGGKPSTLILLQKVTPESLGVLLAIYEHQTVVEGFLYGINPFDQWGVERGKHAAAQIDAYLYNQMPECGSVSEQCEPGTVDALRWYRQHALIPDSLR